MNPGAKYNEFTLLLDRIVVNKNMISCLHISSWSLELILCGFEVHMSTITSPTESFKLLLEMILWAHLCFENVYLFGLFIWINTTPVGLILNKGKATKIGMWFSKMKFDIHLRSFAMPCSVYGVSPVEFYSAGKSWKHSKTETITLSVSAGKCGPGGSTILSPII